MTTNNHPANGPLSLDRLHQISEILSKASAQSDGGNLGYAMADAVKVIDGAIASFDSEPVAWRYRYVKKGITDSQVEPWVGDWKYMPTKEDCNDRPSYEIQALYAAPPAQLVNAIDETLIEALRLVQCMLDDYRERNYGHAQEWIRHISAKMDDYSEQHGDDAYSVISAAMLQGKAEFPAYEIKRFGEFGANGLTRDDGELAISIQLFHFERGTTPEPVQRGDFVEKYALQAIINSLQQRCDELSDTPVTVIWPAAPQQEVKSALEHGMQRYAGAMQKLSEGDK